MYWCSLEVEIPVTKLQELRTTSEINGVRSSRGLVTILTWTGEWIAPRDQTTHPMRDPVELANSGISSCFG